MRSYLKISSSLFGLIAVVHLLRLLRHWPAVIAGQPVPAWTSAVALVVTAALSIWGVRLLGALKHAA
jgi:hypothetical protein